MGVDLTKHNLENNWAIYIPAISGFYIQQLSKMNNDPDYFGKGRLGPSFDEGHYGLNFFDKDRGYYHYKWGLFSAGHAKLNLAKSREKEQMVQLRDRSETLLIGDSGGFQIAKATGDFKNVDWGDFHGKGGDKIRHDILHWLEATADWSMTLDVPAYSSKPPLCYKTGLSTFQDTLDLSLVNLHYFMKNRTPGKTKFLNVLSGTDIDNSRKWYQGVKHFSIPDSVEEMGYSRDRTLEGYAMAGINMQHMRTVLERIVDLCKDGLLEGKDWIHWLGIGRLDWACYLTIIQQELRKHYNPDITVSFDAASPFVAVAKGQCYSYNYYKPKRWGYNMDKAIDDRTCKGSTMQFPFQSPITNRMTVGDVCRLGPGEPNRTGKVANTSWDNMSYLLMMSHNVYNHIQAVQEANRLMQYELTRHTLNYRDWSKEKKRSVASEVSNFVPSNILFFSSFVKELLDPATKDPYKMLEDNDSFLSSISFGGTKTNMADVLFDWGTTLKPEEDYASIDDDDLTKLEQDNQGE